MLQTVTKFLEQYVEEVLRQAAAQLQDHPDRPKLPLVQPCCFLHTWGMGCRSDPDTGAHSKAGPANVFNAQETGCRCIAQLQDNLDWLKLPLVQSCCFLQNWGMGCRSAPDTGAPVFPFSSATRMGKPMPANLREAPETCCQEKRTMLQPLAEVISETL